MWCDKFYGYQILVSNRAAGWRIDYASVRTQAGGSIMLMLELWYAQKKYAEARALRTGWSASSTYIVLELF